jgi:hypothetical protein
LASLDTKRFLLVVEVVVVLIAPLFLEAVAVTVAEVLVRQIPLPQQTVLLTQVAVAVVQVFQALALGL